jgi:hypothetical protein
MLRLAKGTDGIEDLIPMISTRVPFPAGGRAKPQQFLHDAARILFWAALLILVGIPEVEAGRGWGLKMGERICEADLIVVGLITEAEKVSTPQGFFRLSTIAPDQVLKGSLPAEGLELIERSRASFGDDPPGYIEGVEIIAFLKPVPATMFYETVGRSQGRFVIVDGKMPGAKNMPAEEFVDEIKGLLGSEETCISGVPPVPF